MFEFEKIDEGMYLFKGTVNTGILISNGKILLVDCCEMLADALQAFAGTNEVDTILFTQHRRPNTSGVYRWNGTGTKIIVPKNERTLFDNVEQYWEDPKNRLHLYHHQPSSQILPCSIQVSSTVSGNDIIAWEEYAIKVLDTPGATDGSVSYIITKDGRCCCFSGDLIYADENGIDVVDGNSSVGEGKIWDIYSLQKGEGFLDYHGYMGNWKKLCMGLESILVQKPEMLIPSHGCVIKNPNKSVDLLIKRLSSLYANYASISSMNHYFPGFFDGKTEPCDRMKPAATFDFPAFIKPVGYTSSLILSETGDGFLVDCGNDIVVDNLKNLQVTGSLGLLEGCWVTHYHDDHVDALAKLEETFHCPIFTCVVMKDILDHPDNYYLPCLSAVSVQTTGLDDGFQWKWKEFSLTAWYCPGQSFYHGALFVEGHGVKVLFAGDSFSPSGIDDYCSDNRNFSGKGEGFRYCINLIRKLQPDFIINQHQDKAFRFSDDELDFMEKVLVERENMLSEILPWENPNFGTDESWVCAYPYWQTAPAGSEITVSVRFTNHGMKAVEANAVPVLPDGWELASGTGKESVMEKETATEKESTTISPRKSGSSPVLSDHDGSISFRIIIPDHAPGKTVVIPLRIDWDGICLGQIRHALVQII